MDIAIGRTFTGATVSLPLRFANRHGLVTGSTGTGKTVTLQRLAEEFSRAGVPVFAADVKGDLSGIGAVGDPEGPAAARAAALGVDWRPRTAPLTLWDIFGAHGLPIRTSVQAMGALLLSSMLKLNETQAGALAIAFKRADDLQQWPLTLDDLRWQLNELLELREEVCRTYGHVTSSSIAAIQRAILALEAQGGAHLFGEPPFDIMDFLQVDAAGHGVVNLLHADQLLEAPRLFATFLLWLLTEIFRKLPEAGDLEKPRLIFFFDEAHLLFRDAPAPLLQQIERLVRLVRSKGVGVYFVTQSPSDVPDVVLAQLGARVQHSLRVFTPKEQRLVRAAADAFRPNPSVDVRSAITTMGIGEALVSVIGYGGVPTPVERVRILAPTGQIGPLSEIERSVFVEQSTLRQKYGRSFDETEAQRIFVDRLRAERGLPAINWETEAWRPGDFEKFVPRFDLPPPKTQEAGRYLPKAAAAFATASFAILVLT